MASKIIDLETGGFCISLKASHTAVAISAAEEPLGLVRVRASADQLQRLLAWAQAWPERAWAVEGAGGVGQLLSRRR